MLNIINMEGKSVKLMFFVLTIITCYTEVSKGSALIPNDKTVYHDLKLGRGLYNRDEKITVLNATNFKSHVFGMKNAWLIEFYNSWCGFCHRFAPTWRALASDLYGWKDVVTLGALDCANDENTPLCREFEIMYYPMLKFFSAESKPGQLGIEIQKGNNIKEIRHSIVEVLQKEQMAGRGISWPNITPYRNSEISNLWKNNPDSLQFIILIFEDSESVIGTEAILDLHQVHAVQIRSVLSQNEALMKLMGVSAYPSIVAVNRQAESVPLRVGDNSREALRLAIKAFLQMHDISVPKDEVVLDPGEWKNFEPPDLVALMAEAEQEKHSLEVKKLGDVVFQVDLENTVRYTLFHEVAARKVIWGDALQALGNYLKVLVKHFPITPNGVIFFKKLHEKVLSVKEITGQSFADYSKELETQMKSVFSSPAVQEWVGCKGTQPNFRGFPCGLWTTFHMLTVNSALQHDHSDSQEVLSAMLGYVMHFFGCQDCSKHFQEMATSIRDVTSLNGSVLWLWKSHNEVNLRLSGDVSEDPQHPKVQFPSESSCPECRKEDGSWDEESVLNHLNHVYDKHNINFMDLSPDHSKASSSKSVDDNTSNILDKSFLNNGTNRNRSSWNFNFLDVSLCVVLYGISVMILILVCIKFAVRRRYRKKLYVFDLSGKV